MLHTHRFVRRLTPLLFGVVLLAPVGGRGQASLSSPAASASPEWLTDDQGLQYKVDKLSKSLPHMRLEDGRLRTVWGLTVDLAGEDDTDFFVKVYRTDAPAPKAPGPQATPAVDEKAVAESYRFELKTTHTLTFEPFDEGLPQSGQWRNGFALADINGDGFLDIVHGPPRRHPGAPVIFLGDGKGHWRRWSEASFPSVAFDYGSVVVADFNGDKHPDIALGMHLLGVTVLLNDGAGHFRLASEGMDPITRGSTAFSSRALAAVDWDGDGRVDILALGEGPRLMMSPSGAAGATPTSSFGVRLYRNKGDGTWVKAAHDGNSFGDNIAVGHLAGKALGIVTASSRMGSNDILYLAGGSPWTIKPLDGLRPNALVGGVAVADLDGDGKDDIALGYMSYEGNAWHSGIDVFLQRPKGAWERRALYWETGSRGFTALAAGDLNKDRAMDLVGATGDGRMFVLLNDRKGGFSREDAELTKASEGCRGYHLAVHDLDGDGFGDVVASFAGEPEGPSMANPGCPGEGSLRAWRSRPLLR